MSYDIQASPMLRVLQRWESSCNWITDTSKRLCSGWFGVLMIPEFGHGYLLFAGVFNRTSCRYGWLSRTALTNLEITPMTY